MNNSHRRTLLQVCLIIVAVTASLSAQTGNSFLVHNLVSDLPNISDHQDANLKKPWGNGFGNSPFWVSNTGTGTSTLYDGYGTKAALTVTIPAAANAGTTQGSPTGIVSNIFSGANPQAFVVGTAPANFLFCSLDGLITGWNGAAGTKAVVLVDNSKAGAVYTGCTVGGPANAPMFYAANVNSGKVEAYDASFKPATSAAFSNSNVAAGFAAYNVHSFGGKLYVTYGKQNSQKNNVANGAGNGMVAVFDFSGNLISNLVAGGPLNSPWGVVIAPQTFGPFANDLLVGNFGDGTINVFNPNTGASIGTLKDTSGNQIVIPGLWSLMVGSGASNEDPGTVYFTAGIGGGPNGAGTSSDPIQSHGLIGSIQPAPTFLATGAFPPFTTFVGSATSPTGILNGASFLTAPLAPNTWMSIKGDDLSPITATWQVSGTTLPTALQNVSVTIDGEAAFVSFIGNRQINFLTPSDLLPGSAPKVVVTSNGLSSAPVTSSVIPASPAFFTIATGPQGQNYVAATHADGTLIGPASVKGATGAKGGETISLYATGFGATMTPVPNGQLFGSAIPLLTVPTIFIEDMPATVTFAGFISPGLVQINAVVPTGLPAGDALVVALSGNFESQPGAFLTIAQ